MTDRATLSDSPVTPAQTAELLRGRRTVDRFRTDTVPDKTLIHEAIEVARWAPNHHVTEPWRFALLGPAAQARIVELNTALVTASKGADVGEAKRERWAKMPGWLAVTCQRQEDPVTAREDYAACACAIQNLTLYLHSAGVASKWVSGAVTRESAFMEAIGADPDAEYCVGLIWYGYPLRRPKSQRKGLSEIMRERD